MSALSRESESVLEHAVSIYGFELLQGQVPSWEECLRNAFYAQGGYPRPPRPVANQPVTEDDAPGQDGGPAGAVLGRRSVAEAMAEGDDAVYLCAEDPDGGRPAGEPMGIEAVRRRKARLERDIGDLVGRFVEETGAEIVRIKAYMVDVTGRGDEFRQVACGPVEIEIRL